MKLTARTRKLIAFFLVVSIIIPLMSSFGVWDQFDDSVYASEIPVPDETMPDGTVVPGTNYTYKFNMGEELEIYDYTESFTFDGVPYNGLYRNDFKKSNNIDTGIDELGTLNDPYVVLEITPSVRSTELRGHVGDQGVYSLSKEEVEAIELTENEKAVVENNAIAYMYYKENGSVDNLVNIFNKVSSDPEKLAEEKVKVISELKGFDEYYEQKLKEALEWKRNYEKSVRYYAEANGAQYMFSVDYIWHYQTENGKFVTYTDAAQKDLLTPDGKDASTTNAVAGEYRITNNTTNPVTDGWNSSSVLYTTSNIFTKGCLDLAYDTIIGQDDRIEAQNPVVDQYIFAGWYIKVDDELVSINSADVTDKDLKSTSDLYTAWSVRYYGEEYYQYIPPSDKNCVKIDFGDSAYTVYLPNTIASVNASEAAIHDPRNQLTMCKADQYETFGQYSSGWFYKKYGMQQILDEISAWDFDFSRTKYSTLDSLQSVAPKLMSDTDYYVYTYNCVVSADGVINYYPYNVKVITITPEELNKMVYYDYVKNGYSESEYHESEYLNTFLDNVDFVYLTDGGRSMLFDTAKNIGYTDPSGNNTQLHLEPNKERFPTLYKYVDGELTYDPDLATKEPITKTNLACDLEWQVVYKIYTRLLDSNQKRRIGMIVSKILTDSIGAGDLYNDGAGGTQSNLMKLLELIFINVEPQKTYQYYVDPEYTEYHFQKVRGVTRSEVYKTSHFTGSLYDITSWHLGLFFPFELFGIDHYSACISDTLNGLRPWNSTFARELWEAVGLSYNLGPNQVANPYAYTFNADTHVSQNLTVYDIEYNADATNNTGSVNTSLAFDYFIEVRPSEISGLVMDGDGNVTNYGLLATKSAIEFMVQNVRWGVINSYDRKITITNRVDPQEKFMYGSERVLVDRVVVEDFSVPTSMVHFMYTGSTSGYFVVEYLWTPRFLNIDNDNQHGVVWYYWYTSEQNENVDASLRWIKLPTDKNPDTHNYFKTKQVFKSNVTDSESGSSDVVIEYGEENVTNIQKKVEYGFDALIKPTIYASSDEPHYIIAVKQYASKKAYEEGKSPTSITLKNVTLEKLTYLFNLD